MKGDIKSKLTAELNQSINSERQVVYILVELRKLMEIYHDSKNLNTLRFHCDWAVHGMLDKKLAQEIVRQFDRHQQWADGGPGPDLEFMNSWTATLRLATFRKELMQY